MQSFGGQRPHVIAYPSQALNTAESKYFATHMEALAVLWTLKHFRDIIYGYPVTVNTDHSTVTQLISWKNLTGLLASGTLPYNSLSLQSNIFLARLTLLPKPRSRDIHFADIPQISNFSLSELRMVSCHLRHRVW